MQKRGSTLYGQTSLKKNIKAYFNMLTPKTMAQ